MPADADQGRFGEPLKGKIAVLIEEHFDQTEFKRFNEYFPQQGYQVECDVENAGGQVIYEGDVTTELVVDGNVVSAKHPGVVDKFMQQFVAEIEKEATYVR